MKKLNNIMDTETVTVQPKGEEFEIIVQHDQTGSAYRITLSKNAYEQLRQHFVSICNADSDKLVECSNCGDKVEMISSGEFCPHCFC